MHLSVWFIPYVQVNIRLQYQVKQGELGDILETIIK